MIKTLVALVATGLLVAGCCTGKSGDSGSGSGSGAGPAAATGDSVGVQECDDYLTKLQACLGKMPAAAKPAMEQSFKQSREAWKAAAATPAGKAQLKITCKASLDALAQNPACK
jgi:hypothetical protein